MILDQSDDGTQWYDPVPFPGTSKQGHTLLHDDSVSMASLTGGHSGMRNEDGHIASLNLDVGLYPKPHIQPHIGFDTHGCHVEYYVPECQKGDLCQHRFRNDWKIPYDMEIVIAFSCARWGNQHDNQPAWRSGHLHRTSYLPGWFPGGDLQVRIGTRLVPAISGQKRTAHQS